MVKDLNCGFPKWRFLSGQGILEVAVAAGESCVLVSVTAHKDTAAYFRSKLPGNPSDGSTWHSALLSLGS